MDSEGREDVGPSRSHELPLQPDPGAIIQRLRLHALLVVQGVSNMSSEPKEARNLNNEQRLHCITVQWRYMRDHLDFIWRVKKAYARVLRWASPQYTVDQIENLHQNYKILSSSGMIALNRVDILDRMVKVLRKLVFEPDVRSEREAAKLCLPVLEDKLEYHFVRFQDWPEKMAPRGFTRPAQTAEEEREDQEFSPELAAWIEKMDGCMAGKAEYGFSFKKYDAPRPEEWTKLNELYGDLTGKYEDEEDLEYWGNELEY